MDCIPPHVLVVEDEFFSRWHAVDLVEAAGYKAIEASTADEAIAILEARKDIRVVFTDINMPGSMDGLKLARAIRDRWPPIELILTSGHFDVPESGSRAGSIFFEAISRPRNSGCSTQIYSLGREPIVFESSRVSRFCTGDTACCVLHSPAVAAAGDRGAQVGLIVGSSTVSVRLFLGDDTDLGSGPPLSCNTGKSHGTPAEWASGSDVVGRPRFAERKRYGCLPSLRCCHS
jgi:CheY-like chemotaxis protein